MLFIYSKSNSDGSQGGKLSEWRTAGACGQLQCVDPLKVQLFSGSTWLLPRGTGSPEFLSCDCFQKESFNFRKIFQILSIYAGNYLKKF